MSVTATFRQLPSDTDNPVSHKKVTGRIPLRRRKSVPGRDASPYFQDKFLLPSSGEGSRKEP